MKQSRYANEKGAARKPLPTLNFCLAVVAIAAICTGSAGVIDAAPRDEAFNDPMFRRCISWMLDGTRGALIENLCVNDYALPGPSLFLCARKIMTGFQSEADREGCALIFEEQARKVRAGYLK